MKNYYLKLYLTFLLCCAANVSMNAQSKEPDWNLLSEESNVKIYYAIGLCSGNNKLFVKVENISVINVNSNFDLVTNEEAEWSFIIT